MGLCCLWHSLWPLKLLCWVLLPLLLLFAGLRLWVKFWSKSTLPHLGVAVNGKKPVRIGFFHPYCNAGGGGERVLWTAVRALQNRYAHVHCVVYTGDTSATGEEILSKARERFNIVLPRRVEFVFLNRRGWVEAERYPYFTMLGQSLGSLFLGWEALTKFIPDMYVDSMGYAFTLPLFKYVGGCVVSCYVHYPTISTDMLERVSNRKGIYNNRPFISRSPVLSWFKLLYYKLFAYAYGAAGARSEVVMVNSTWTRNHITSLWKADGRTFVVYPPCDTEEFTSIPVTDKSHKKVQSIVSIAQFRPEKDHPLQIRSFKEFLDRVPNKKKDSYKLILIGSSRNEGDARRVDDLKKMCADLNLAQKVEFKLNISFDDLKKCLAEATVGLHTMLDEHFGIGVVELMAAGTVTLAHKSGGPKLDIVTEHNGEKTGFLADSVETYADAMEAIFTMSAEDRARIIRNSRDSTVRFSEACFEESFLSALELGMNLAG